MRSSRFRHCLSARRASRASPTEMRSACLAIRKGSAAVFCSTVCTEKGCFSLRSCGPTIGEFVVSDVLQFYILMRRGSISPFGHVWQAGLT